MSKNCAKLKTPTAARRGVTRYLQRWVGIQCPPRNSWMAPVSKCLMHGGHRNTKANRMPGLIRVKNALDCAPIWSRLGDNRHGAANLKIFPDRNGRRQYSRNPRLSIALRYNAVMLKFSIRDILVSTALIAIGLAMLLGGQLMNSLAATWSWPFAWPILGAGVLFPFKHALWGAALGTLLMLAILLAQVL